MLVEILVVLAIVALVMGAVIGTFRSLRRTTAKSAAEHLAAAIRYTYDRAVTTGVYYRLVFDLGKEKASYLAEKSDARFYLVRDKEDAPGRGRAPDEAERERKRKEEKEKNQPQMTGLGAQLQQPAEPRRARFEAFQDSNLPKVELKDIRIRDIYTPRQIEPYAEGKAYLYFFPDGHTERALIHIEDSDGDVYSLLVQPLTGRVEVRVGDVPVGREFDVDAEGRAEAPR